MAYDEAKHVFISYVREDAVHVNKLCALLDAAQIPYWRDRKSLAPGDQWERKIREAIRSGALVFLACFSEQSRKKQKSYMNEEITIAVEEFRKLPPGATWLIPVRFDNGDIPEWDLGAGRTLSYLNYSDLHGDDYAAEAVKLTTVISHALGSAGPDAATVRASVEEADESQRPAMIQRLTKEMIVDPARRIDLDDLIASETVRILSAMRDNDRFPTTGLQGAPGDQIIKCAEVATEYWKLAEPLCASLQVAARWAERHSLNPWETALKAISSEAAHPQSGHTALIDLRHVPTLAAVFTVALAASSQGRWDTFKVLLMDVTVPHKYGERREALLQAENPWTPFSDLRDSVPDVLAYAAVKDCDFSVALDERKRKPNGLYLMPIAEWLYTILRPLFSQQHPDEDAFGHAFDRTEVMLGIVSQDLGIEQTGDGKERSWLRPSRWFGRSAWRANSYRSSPVEDIMSEIQAQGESWAPLSAGLFGGSVSRASKAVETYKNQFDEARHQMRFR